MSKRPGWAFQASSWSVFGFFKLWTSRWGREIRFMERLIKDSKKKVFLIVDNLRVHHSAPVKECIALFHLPSYSPERNPDEYLNGD